jgi:carbamoyltransferase
MNILGINAYHGDVSAVLVRDGQLVAAVEEERFRRVKHWAGFPAQAIDCCLRMADIKPRQVDAFAVSRSVRANLSRKLLFSARHWPSFSLLRDRAQNSGSVHHLSTVLAHHLGLEHGYVRPRMHYVEHHPAHLASSFFVSPFQEAAVCAIDGFGDFVSTSFALGRGNTLDVRKRVFFPHSLGLLYLAITQFLGFMKYGDEYKVMGLAPYGTPRHDNAIRRLLHLKQGDFFELDLSYFKHWSEGAPMTWDDGEPTLGRVFTLKLEELLGPARSPEQPVDGRHEDIAASLQVVYEEAAFHVLNEVYRRVKLGDLCLAGGCAMNSVANGKVREHTPFKRIFIQPAAGDNGTALGAAYYVWNHVLGRPRSFVMQNSYWGPEFDQRAMHQTLSDRWHELQDFKVTRVGMDDELCAWTAERIAAGDVVGWFQGRMEWGARALGNRSIVADPRRPDMREIINTKIKFRERFRPFAPSIAEENLDEYFVGAVPDPYMVQVYPVRPEKRTVIPAVTHVDGSGRLQTVSRTTNPLYWKLIKAFEARTGVPVLLNTSFNENEPIVHRPSEALDCFLRTRMDVLVLGPYVLRKQNPTSQTNQTRAEEAVSTL